MYEMFEISNVFETEVEDDQGFIELALKFGTPIKSREQGNIIDNLVSVKSSIVEKDSLSKRYGLEEFPSHTDCAYLKTPPKYIFLRYVGNIVNPTATGIVEFDLQRVFPSELDFLLRKIWFVKAKQGGFYSTILKDGMIRYDPEVMRMVNSDENKMIKILSKMERKEIHWTKNKVAIINNHTVLHFRPKVALEENRNRILQRINIL